MQIEVTAILLQMFNFGVVLAALTYLLLKPVRRILDERSRRVAEGQKAADEAIAEKAALEELKEKAVKEGRAKAKELLAEAHQEVEKKREEWLAQAKADAEAARNKAKKAIDAERTAALTGLQQEFETAVMAVAEKVVGSALDAKKHDALIKQGLKEIAAAK